MKEAKSVTMSAGYDTFGNAMKERALKVAQTRK